ncbi:hypothetical protein CYMTET_35851, partial [Cymbomonas tetramitiformis]
MAELVVRAPAGDWYVKLEGDSLGLVQGSLVDGTKETLTLLPTTPVWEGCNPWEALNGVPMSTEGDVAAAVPAEREATARRMLLQSDDGDSGGGDGTGGDGTGGGGG